MGIIIKCIGIKLNNHLCVHYIVQNSAISVIPNAILSVVGGYRTFFETNALKIQRTEQLACFLFLLKYAGNWHVHSWSMEILFNLNIMNLISLSGNQLMV